MPIGVTVDNYWNHDMEIRTYHTADTALWIPMKMYTLKPGQIGFEIEADRAERTHSQKVKINRDPAVEYYNGERIVLGPKSEYEDALAAVRPARAADEELAKAYKRADVAKHMATAAKQAADNAHAALQAANKADPVAYRAAEEAWTKAYAAMQATSEALNKAQEDYTSKSHARDALRAVFKAKHDAAVKAGAAEVSYDMVLT